MCPPSPRILVLAALAAALVFVEAGSHEIRARNELGAQATTVRELSLVPVALAAPRSRFGQVAVSATPAGATLSLNFKPLGKAPWSGELESGQHVIEADLDGYLTQTVRLDLQTGEERDIHLELTKTPWYRRWYFWTAVVGVVVVGAATAGAVVAIESKPDVSIPLP